MSHRFPNQAQEIESEFLRFPKQVQEIWREFRRDSDKGQKIGCASSGVLSVPSEMKRVIGFMISVTKLISHDSIKFASDFLCDRGSTVVKVLCYKSEGLWLDSRWCHWNFSLT